MRHRLLAAAAVACGGLLAFPATGWGAPRPIGGNDFVARLDNARRLAEAGAAQPAPPKMQAVREALGLPIDVDLAGGTVHVPADGLLDGLRGTTTEDFRNADDHLAAMEDDARAAVRAKAPDAPRMAAALQGALRGIRTEPSAGIEGARRSCRHPAALTPPLGICSTAAVCHSCSSDVTSWDSRGVSSPSRVRASLCRESGGVGAT